MRENNTFSISTHLQIGDVRIYKQSADVFTFNDQYLFLLMEVWAYSGLNDL